MKNKILTMFIALSLFALVGCNNQKDVSIKTIEAPTESAVTPTENVEVTTENALTKDINGLVTLIKSNELVRENLLNQCMEGQEDCINRLPYKLDTTNVGYYLISFLGIGDEDKPFGSTEIYKVDIVNGDIFRLSPFSGEYEYLTNLLNK